ncbi:MAG TPA: S1/P1 nuclease, partial [Cyclobacteriaceae bacterium]|nr:S1/P1 nuclease [Cyclobacteriaceae bacterium]
PNGDIIQTLERLIAELKQGGLDAKTKAEHVKMIVHLVGDIHQPLHVGKEGDKGGNDIRVTWFRNNSNLHRVWDSDIINGTQLSYTELAESLGRPDKETLTKWQKAGVREWAKESMTYRERIYDIGDGNLSYEYSYKNYDLVKLRILQAGVRMAAVFNEIFG